MNLKDEFNPPFVESLAKSISAEYASFDRLSFCNSVLDDNWNELELKERIRRITESINSHLPLPYSKQTAILKQVAPQYPGLQGFVFPDFVQVYGLKDIKNSFSAMELFTQFSTSEFAVRPFIENYPEESMKQMRKWSQHKNHHLRRLSSEGSRPRLPWAPPLRKFIADPTPTLGILESLKNDESEYVRKSVANHLNDISKDHPNLVLKISKEWYGKSNYTNWIIKHALRSLLKKGNKQALSIFGLDNSEKIGIDRLTLSKEKIRIGEFVFFEFDVINNSNERRNIRLEYKIDYVKANRSTSPKVFQLSEFELAPKSNKSFTRKQSFKELSTRKHYAGNHKIRLIVNGDEKDNIDLVLES